MKSRLVAVGRCPEALPDVHGGTVPAAAAGYAAVEYRLLRPQPRDHGLNARIGPSVRATVRVGGR